jgi:hypothetical protein
MAVPQENGPVAECDLSASAVYAHRLIVTRDFAGWGLGAELIDWTGFRGRLHCGAKWIRIDVCHPTSLCMSTT